MLGESEKYASDLHLFRSNEIVDSQVEFLYTNKVTKYRKNVRITGPSLNQTRFLIGVYDFLYKICDRLTKF